MAISTELPLKRRRINTGRTSPLAHSCSSESFEKGSHKSRLFIFDYSSEVIEIHIQNCISFSSREVQDHGFYDTLIQLRNTLGISSLDFVVGTRK